MCLKVVWLPFQSIHIHKILLLSYRSTLHQWTFKEACQWLNCSIILAIYWKPHSRYWPNVHLTPPPWKNVLVYSPLIDPCLRKSCLRTWLDDEPRTIVLFLSIKSYWHTGWSKKRFGRKDAGKAKKVTCTFWPNITNATFGRSTKGKDGTLREFSKPA